MLHTQYIQSDTVYRLRIGIHAGGGLAGDCAPVESNHNKFYAAAPGVAWEVVIADCGHFQFLDRQSLVQQAICGQVRPSSCLAVAAARIYELKYHC